MSRIAKSGSSHKSIFLLCCWKIEKETVYLLCLYVLQLKVNQGDSHEHPSKRFRSQQILSPFTCPYYWRWHWRIVSGSGLKKARISVAVYERDRTLDARLQ